MFPQRSRIHFFALAAAWLLLAPAAAPAQDSAPQAGDPVQQLHHYLMEGTKRRAAGDVDSAIALMRKALDLSEKHFGPDDAWTAMSLNYLGEAYLDKGDFGEAERLMLRSLKIQEKFLEEAREELASSPNAQYVYQEYAKVLHDLGVVYDYLGDYSRAQPLYERALALREKYYGPEHTQVALSLNYLANLYRAKADYARAAQMFERALAIFQKALAPDHRAVTTVLNNLALTYNYQGDLAKAEALYRDAIARAEKRLGPESLEVATYLNNLGLLFSDSLKNPAQARPLLERALAIREKLLSPNDPVLAVTLNNIGMLDWMEGELKRAEQSFLRALDIQQRAYGPAHPDVAHVLSNLALLYVGMGDTKRGIGLLSEGSKHSERNLLLKLATGSEEQKRIYMASIEEGTSGNVSLHLRAAPADAEAARLAMNTILWRKGRVLDVMSGQAASTLVGSDAEGRDALAKLAEARGQLSVLALKGSDGDAQYKERVEALRAQIQALEKMVSERATAAAGGSFDPVTVEAVQAAIPAGGALVEVVQYRPAPIGAAILEWGPPRYAAYVLKSKGAPTALDLGEAAKVDAEVSRLRAALRNPRRDDARATARAVDELVMRPVRKLLGDITQVLVSPDGALNLVPFGALVDEQNRYLVESYTFTYLTSGRDLLRVRERPTSKQGPVVVANPLYDKPTAAASRPPAATATVARAAGVRSASFDEKFTPLAGTAEEAREVSAILGGANTYTGAQATESAVKQVTAPSILHIATHGFFLADAAEADAAAGTRRHGHAPLHGARALMAENPLLRSGLALAGANELDGGQGEDGVLTALEAAGLDLHGTELIVLSACETGLGVVQSGEGVYGLRRALVLAGAESQLMSLWKVNDDATRELMVGFYRRLRDGGGRSEALRQVQLKMLGGEEYSHPYFWAGFIMSGKWGPLGREASGAGAGAAANERSRR